MEQKPSFLLKYGWLMLGLALLLVLFGISLKFMSWEGASEMIIVGYLLGIGGLFFLVLPKIVPLFKER